MSPVAISVVIPALDAAATIGQQLDALATQTVARPWEVVVVDNGSTDGTPELAAGYADRLRIRVVHCPTPGSSAARNLGAKVAEGELLLFCDADDVVADGWVEALAEALDRADAAGGAIENDLLNADVRHLRRHPAGLPVVAGFLPRAITANFGVRSAVLAALGGFAEEYDYGAPDTELCWRLQLAGYSLVAAPEAVVHYRHRQSLRGAARKAYRTGIARARLFRDYGSQGMPQPRLAGAVVRWARLVVAAPAAAVSAPLRWWWAEEAAGAWGRVVGSRRFGVRYL